MDDKLFKAILSMDSYNRGYNQGIILPVVPNLTQIANATIVSQSDTDPTHDPVKHGFYAIAYQYDSQITIAYRGTDQYISPIAKDVVYGYGIGLGLPETRGAGPNQQSQQAFEFYLAVSDLQNWPLTLH